MLLEARGIPKAFSQEFANGNPNPLYKFHVIVPDNVNLDSLADAGIVREREFDTHREPLRPSLLNPYTRPQKIEELFFTTRLWRFQRSIRRHS